MRLEHGAQALAAQELHHHVRRAVLAKAEVQHLDDVAVVDLGRGERLAHEALAHLVGQLVAAPVRDHGLERDRSPQPGVDGAVDRSHAALADIITDLVAVDALSLHQ